MLSSNPADLVSLELVDSWPKAVVAVTLVVCVLVVPQVGAWVQARRSASAADAVRRTLTTNNGGSHVKDSLDRIERTQAMTTAELRAIARRVEKLERRRRFAFFG